MTLVLQARPAPQQCRLNAGTTLRCRLRSQKRRGRRIRLATPVGSGECAPKLENKLQAELHLTRGGNGVVDLSGSANQRAGSQGWAGCTAVAGVQTAVRGAAEVRMIQQIEEICVEGERTAFAKTHWNCL